MSSRSLIVLQHHRSRSSTLFTLLLFLSPPPSLSRRWVLTQLVSRRVVALGDDPLFSWQKSTRKKEGGIVWRQKLFLNVKICFSYFKVFFIVRPKLFLRPQNKIKTKFTLFYPFFEVTWNVDEKAMEKEILVSFRVLLKGKSLTS